MHCAISANGIHLDVPIATAIIVLEEIRLAIVPTLHEVLRHAGNTGRGLRGTRKSECDAKSSAIERPRSVVNRGAVCTKATLGLTGTISDPLLSTSSG